jgi:hypothetical protein
MTVLIQYKLLKYMIPNLFINTNAIDNHRLSYEPKKDNQQQVFKSADDDDDNDDDEKWMSMETINSKSSTRYMMWIGVGYMATFFLQQAAEVVNQMVVSEGNLRDNEQWVNHICVMFFLFCVCVCVFFSLHYYYSLVFVQRLKPLLVCVLKNVYTVCVCTYIDQKYSPRR